MNLTCLRRAVLIATVCVVSTRSSAAQADFNEVGRQVAIMLQNSHYARVPFNAETGQRFLDAYLRRLDASKVYFTRQDVDRFKAGYGDNLYKLLIQGKVLEAVNDIHGVFLQRVDARAAMARKFLKEDPLDFTGHDSMARSRKEAAWPKDNAEADALLCQQLKEAVLSEAVLRELQAKMAEEQGKPDPAARVLPPRETIALRYERVIHGFRDAAADDVAGNLFEAMARSCDPHSDYMTELEAIRFYGGMKNEFVGIGIDMKPEDDGSTGIQGIVVGGPADREGSLLLGDRILAVDTDASGSFTDIRFMSKFKIESLVRGKVGSTLRLKIQAGAAGPGESRIVTINREKVVTKDDQAAAAILDTKAGEGIPHRLGVITLPSFYADSAAGETRCSVDVERLLRRLIEEKIDGLVFDLRDNPGGSLEEVRRMTGFFAGMGPVVQEKDRLGQIKVSQADNRKAIYEGPLVLLLNKGSASASEILAGALQDDNRAVIVGDSSTFGKGTVQEPLDIARLLPFFANRDGAGLLKLTVRRFYRPSGASTQLDGVASDIVLPGPLLRDGGGRMGELFLDQAFSRDRISPAPGLRPLARDGLFLPRLRELSESRVKAGRDFVYYADDAKRDNERWSRDTVSLNLEERRREAFASHALHMERNAERRERFRDQEAGDAGALKMTRLTLDDLSKGAAFHPADPAGNTGEYVRRAKDPVADLDNSPRWPSGLDPVEREALNVLSDLVDSSEGARVASVTPKRPAEIR